MKYRRSISILTTFILLTGTVMTAGAAQFGLRIGQYNDANELFIGAELLSPVQHRLYFNPNIEYVLVDHLTYFTANADFHYDIPVNTNSIFLWAGGGVGLGYLDPEGDIDAETELALNLLFGLGLNLRGSLTPYVQGKFILGDLDEFVLAFGLRF